MKFKRTCCECGKKTSILINGKCEECHCYEFPPIKEFRQITFQVCNVTKKIAYNNIYYPQDEIIEKIPEIVKSKLDLNDGYSLVDLEIDNIEIDGHKISFDVHIECEFNQDEMNLNL